ncbi:actin-histidine N-methyltransferase-like [Oscarella lobularis]|uniref:actin-histidine N-methyltransferase-like n=1 Tax=Oscarella lobularis TaxID=121494 RepID=UPI003314244E
MATGGVCLCGGVALFCAGAMGKKSRRPRQKSAKQTYRPDPDIVKLVDGLLKACVEATKREPPKTPKEQWDDFVEIRKHLDELEAKQGTEAEDGLDERPARSECVAPFRDWLTANGAEVQDVTFEEIPGRGFGVKALKPLEKHELFFSIPYKLMMTSVCVKESSLGPLVKNDRLLQSLPSAALSLYLLAERWNPDSFWRPYIDMLPKMYTIPLFYSVDEVRMLEGSPVYLEVLNQNRSIARQYAYLHQMIYSHPDAKNVVLSQKPFNYVDFKWAVGSVLTRQNSIPIRDGDAGFSIGLISAWDMCNHANGAITTDYKEEEKACKCYAMNDYEAGSEVTMFYGTRTNAEFLLNQGFVYKGNEHDRMRLKLGVSKNDSLFAMKAEILSRLDIPTSAIFYIYDSVAAPFTSQLMAFLRVFCMTHDELKAKLQGSEEVVQMLMGPRGIVNFENETKALDFIQTRCLLLLKQYKTSIEEDNALLAKEETSISSKEIAKLLIGEKTVLHQAISFVRAQKEALESYYKARQEDEANSK